MSEQRVVCVDLDGVLNVFDGWRGENYFHPPRPGAERFLRRLWKRNFRIVILTVRWPGHVEEWLRQFGLKRYVHEVTDKKPPAHVYIDDRAICFHGDFDRTLREIAAFKAHWE